MSADVAGVRDLPEAISTRIAVSDNECWLWTGALVNGYARLPSTRWSSRRAHRVVYEMLVGPIQDGMELDHLCRNRPCVNPDHLDPVTGLENKLRGLSGYGLRTLCKSGRHDISDPKNVQVRPGTGRRTCRPCYLEVNRNARRRAAARLTDGAS